jgi:hypothetical protein
MFASNNCVKLIYTVTFYVQTCFLVRRGVHLKIGLPSDLDKYQFTSCCCLLRDLEVGASLYQP